MNRFLKILRIAASLLVFLIITAALTALPLAVYPFAQWIEKIQFLPAVILFNLVIFVGWLIITLIFGRIYCSSVCPIGTLMDIFSRTRMIVSPRVYRFSTANSRIRNIVLIGVLICLMAGSMTIPIIITPYSAYCRICCDLFQPLYSLISGSESTTGMAWWNNVVSKALAGWASTSVAAISLVIIAILSAAKGRILCNSICPVGTTLGFISRFSIFQFDIDTDKCTNCRKCEYVCKCSCINLNDHVVDGSRCVNCFNCVNVCPDDAIRYTFRRKQLSIPMMQSVKPILPEPTLENSAPPHTCNTSDENKNIIK